MVDTVNEMGHLKFYCLNGCKYRCDFDVGEDVFCHAVGRDLTKDDLKLLRQVGCATRRPKQKIEEHLVNT